MIELSEKIMMSRLGKTHMFFLGQAGFVIKSSKGTLIAIDVYLTNCCERKYGFKRLMPMLLDPFELQFDGVVCTHEHYDHFDIDAVPAMLSNGKTQLIAGKDCKKLVEKYEIPEEQTHYLGNGDAYVLKDICIQAVFCDHGVDAPDAIGLVITIEDKKIYVAGDTRLRLDKVTEILQYGSFDIMIAPINGAYGNLNEREAVQLCEQINPGLFIPCHYWNFGEHGGNPGFFAQTLRERLPGQKYLIMAMGEQYTI